MIKMLFRFFLLCILFTIILAVFISYLDKKISSKENYAYMNTITHGKFILLDRFLRSYPVTEWETILNQIRPKNASTIHVIPLKDLSLNKNQLQQLIQNKIVTVFDKSNTFYPAVVYKKTSNPNYVYQEFLNFSLSQRANQYFGWSPLLITKELQSIPPERWASYTKKLSEQYGFNVELLDINQLKLSDDQKKQLIENDWVVSLPKSSDQIIERLYAPIGKQKVLQFGPMQYIFIGVYAKYFIFTAALVAIEFIIFILALLFFRTLEKLKILADDYSKGNFDSTVQISSTSILYSLFSDLKSMGKKIKSLITSHKELTHAVSHELRTPLSRLRFSVELASQSSDINEIKNRLNSVENDVEELEKLISEMLNYAKLNQPIPQLKFEKIELSQLILSAIEKFKKSENNIKFITNISLKDKHYFVNANRAYIERCLQNLLQNAEKFARSTIEVTLKKGNEGYYQLSIEDDGPGIPIEDRTRIFEPFVQLSNQIKNSSAGFGLGLAIVKKIIDIHYWNIQVADSKMGGTKIILFFNRE